MGNLQMTIAGTDPTSGRDRGEEKRDDSLTHLDEPHSDDKSRRERQEDLLDESLEDTFPASDPIAVLQPTYVSSADC